MATRAGARVAVHGRDAEALAKVADRIIKEGGQVMTVAGDVTYFSEVEAMRHAEGGYSAHDSSASRRGRAIRNPGQLHRPRKQR